MRKLTLLLPVAGILFFLYSCQKELSDNYDLNAKGNLNKDGSGNCVPLGVHGTYSVTKALDTSNYIEAPVTITQPGSYYMYTDTVNGIYFKAAGTVAAAGTYKIKLPGTGTPVAAGTDNFTVYFQGSSCITTIETTSGPAAGPAEFTLQGSPGSCMNAVVTGDYLLGVALNSTNTVTINIDATKTGNYTISTSSVNGYSFSASGSITTIGNQSILLSAAGTPTREGTDNFTINGVSSGCGFPVSVLNAVPTYNNDHFPLTTFNFWSFDDLVNVGDTATREINDSTVLGGNNYKVMQEQYRFGLPSFYNLRKTGNDYYEYGAVDKYTVSLAFVPAKTGDILFLKENLKTGDTWNSSDYIGTISSGQPIYLRYAFECNNADSTVIINRNTFLHVYKITMRPQLKSAVTDPYNGTGEVFTFLYARGIGPLYIKKTNNGLANLELRIRNWDVH